MAKIDKIREEIGWLKVVFATLIAIDISLSAWLFKNISIYPFMITLITIAGIIFISGLIVVINFFAYVKIQEIGGKHE